MKAQELVAKNMRRLRVARGLSQDAFAVDAGIDRTYVSRLERRLENPSVAVLARIAEALGVDIRELFDPKGAAIAVKALPAGRKRRKPKADTKAKNRG
jgi:transcriptional regulator with XRE-family HTH domain